MLRGHRHGKQNIRTSTRTALAMLLLQERLEHTKLEIMYRGRRHFEKKMNTIKTKTTIEHGHSHATLSTEGSRVSDSTTAQTAAYAPLRRARARSPSTWRPETCVSLRSPCPPAEEAEAKAASVRRRLTGLGAADPDARQALSAPAARRQQRLRRAACTGPPLSAHLLPASPPLQGQHQEPIRPPLSRRR